MRVGSTLKVQNASETNQTSDNTCWRKVSRRHSDIYCIPSCQSDLKRTWLVDLGTSVIRKSGAIFERRWFSSFNSLTLSNLKFLSFQKIILYWGLLQTSAHEAAPTNDGNYRLQSHCALVVPFIISTTGVNKQARIILPQFYEWYYGRIFSSRGVPRDSAFKCIKFRPNLRPLRHRSVKSL